MTEEAWAELTEYVDRYLSLRSRRTNYPFERERARWEHLGDAVDVATVILRELRDAPRSGPSLEWIHRALDALVVVRHKVEIHTDGHEMWQAYCGRQNPDSEFLYGGVLQIWTYHLHGDLRYSSSKTGGPTVDFFLAVVKPIMGDKAPQPTSVGKIIRREREGRDRVEAEKRRRRGVGL
jgi:hypothetical protein